MAERELGHQVQVTGAVGIIAAEDRLSQVTSRGTRDLGLRFVVSQGSGESLPEGRIPFSSLLAESKRLDLSVGKSDLDTPAVLPFSSGTTGLPKGVMLTHSNLLYNLYQVVQAHGVKPDDTLLNQLPFFHIYGMTVSSWGPPY